MPTDSSKPTAPTSDVKESKSLRIVLIATIMLLCLTLPLAAGALTYFYLADISWASGLRRPLLSVAAFLMTMMFCNLFIVLPLGHAAAMLALRPSLTKEEADLLHNLQAHAQHTQGLPENDAQPTSTDAETPASHESSPEH